MASPEQHHPGYLQEGGCCRCFPVEGWLPFCINPQHGLGSEPGGCLLAARCIMD